MCLSMGITRKVNVLKAIWSYQIKYSSIAEDKTMPSGIDHRSTRQWTRPLLAFSSHITLKEKD